ncbi:MAG: gliding motility-associated-like protein, partial [Patiriisocius sp.]
GQTISYVFIVTNTGNVTLYNITLEDPLPGIIISGGPIAELIPGEVDDSTFTAEYTVTQADINAGKVINQAIATGETGDGDEVTDTSDDPNDPTDTDINGDGDPDDPTVTILPNVLGTFNIFNAVSPDGNGENDIFLIQGISEYPENSVQIFNRWGVKVFEVDGYGGSNDLENVFTGESDGRATIEQGTLLPTGTYFYVLKFSSNNPGQETYAGYLYLNR